MKLGITVGVPKERSGGETRVAATPDSVKRLLKNGFDIHVEEGAGLAAGFHDQDYEAAGACIVSEKDAWSNRVVAKVTPPSTEESARLQSGALIVSLLEPFRNSHLLDSLAAQKIDALALESIPRTSRAQSMDVLSSQAGIAGYRAVLEATSHYGRFFPMMMTSAGSAKATKVTVLGAGVAGLQAIATARKLGAQVDAYDVRPEVREQIQSLGAKYIDIRLEESGSGQGGYAKELSEESKKRLQAALDEHLAKSDIIITTANVPGRKAPILITESVVKNMRRGSVIVDMATPSGGNCPLSVPDKVVEVHGVKIVGHTNYPAMMATDSSNFFARNLVSLFDLFVARSEQGDPTFIMNLEDEIIDASLLVHQGVVRLNKKELALMSDTMLAVYVFTLACFVGYHVIWGVTPALHTPLMAVTNAISAILVIGAILVAGSPVASDSLWIQIIGFCAVLLASINIFGGFVVTNRILAMFRKK